MTQRGTDSMIMASAVITAKPTAIQTTGLVMSSPYAQLHAVYESRRGLSTRTRQPGSIAQTRETKVGKFQVLGDFDCGSLQPALAGGSDETGNMEGLESGRQVEGV